MELSFKINTYMQNLPIYLYPNTLDVILDLDPTIQGVNRVMYQHDLKIQKGIKNKVRIQFKNSDQKRIPTTGTFVFSMFDAVNQRLLLEKDITILDDGTTFALRGVGEMVFTESDTIDLDVSTYQFSIKYQDADGTYLSAYADTYYGVAGRIHLLQDIYPVLQPSQEVTDFLEVYDDSIFLYQYKSGNIYAYPEYNSNSALHTVAMYMTNFKGTVLVEGTLYNSPATFNRYVTIATKTYDGFTGIDYENFNGLFSYVRITYQPAKAPYNSNNRDTNYAGTFDKILYRS
jgi:hypothetical protein